MVEERIWMRIRLIEEVLLGMLFHRSHGIICHPSVIEWLSQSPAPHGSCRGFCLQI
jgi:hypothetical protein